MRAKELKKKLEEALTYVKSFDPETEIYASVVQDGHQDGYIELSHFELAIDVAEGDMIMDIEIEFEGE